ncbi:hypothetical protein WDU94_008939 [Cyamophila willieti]
MNSNVDNGVVNKKICHFCGQLVNKVNINRHILSCPLNPQRNEECQLACDKCRKVFNRRDNLKRYLNTCQEINILKKIPCTYPNCSLIFRSRIDLIQHLHSHNPSAVQQVCTKEFANWKEFEEWKDREEHNTFSYYAKKCGEKANTDYYYCEKDGLSKPHCKTGQRKTCKKVAKGTIKKDKHCISLMIVETKDSGTIHLKYYPTHSHELNKRDIIHHPLTNATYKYIDQQIAQNQSAQQIQRNVAKNAINLETEVRKEHKEFFVSTKLISERARVKTKSSQCHSDDAKSVMYLTQKLLKDDPNLVLVYKPFGGPCEIGPEGIDDLPNQNDLFMYGFQTEEQRKLMVQGCKNILVVDETHGTNQYDFQLLNMVIVDENRKGWPVGHFVSSESDENTLKFFFEAISTKCPDLEINCVITDDDPKLINAIEAGFGKKICHLLCKWHLSRTFRKQLREKGPSNLVEEMYLGLKVMVDTKNSNDFQNYCEAFIAKYETLAPDFVS